MHFTKKFKRISPPKSLKIMILSIIVLILEKVITNKKEDIHEDNCSLYEQFIVVSLQSYRPRNIYIQDYIHNARFLCDYVLPWLARSLIVPH